MPIHINLDLNEQNINQHFPGWCRSAWEKVPTESIKKGLADIGIFRSFESDFQANSMKQEATIFGKEEVILAKEKSPSLSVCYV